MFVRALTIAAALALFLAGCGGSDSESTTDTTTASESFYIKAPRPKIVLSTKYLKFKPNGLFGPEPKPYFSNDPPPDFLATSDLVEGIGTLGLEGDKITVQYVGYTYDSRKKFYSSWDEGKPFTFTLGKGEVIEAWEEGIPGMEVSDRREMVVPPELGYGSKRMGKIPPNSTLVYVIDLLKVHGT